MSVASTRFGIGQHINTIPFDDRINGLKLLYIGRLFGLIALAVSKTSFAITLLNLAMLKWQKVSIWFIMITVNITLGVTALTLLIQCTPIHRAWDLAAEGTCWPSNIQITIGIAASGR
jgi:rhodopsin domain-containing protein